MPDPVASEPEWKKQRDEKRAEIQTEVLNGKDALFNTIYSGQTERTLDGAAERFLFTGTELRGQGQYVSFTGGRVQDSIKAVGSSVNKGWAVEGSIKVTHGEVGESAILVLRGPQKLPLKMGGKDSSISIDKPITLHSFTGTTRTFQIDGKAVASFGMKAKVSVDKASGDKASGVSGWQLHGGVELASPDDLAKKLADAKKGSAPGKLPAGAKGEIAEEADDDADAKGRGTVEEIFAVHVDATLAVDTEVKYEYCATYATSPVVTSYADRPSVKEGLIDLFCSKTTEDFVRWRTYEFTSRHSPLFGNVALKTSLVNWEWRTSTSEMFDRLMNTLEPINDPAVDAQRKRLLEDLESFLPSDEQGVKRRLAFFTRSTSCWPKHRENEEIEVQVKDLMGDVPLSCDVEKDHDEQHDELMVRRAALAWQLKPSAAAKYVQGIVKKKVFLNPVMFHEALDLDRSPLAPLVAHIKEQGEGLVKVREALEEWRKDPLASLVNLSKPETIGTIKALLASPLFETHRNPVLEMLAIPITELIGFPFTTDDRVKVECFLRWQSSREGFRREKGMGGGPNTLWPWVTRVLRSIYRSRAAGTVRSFIMVSSHCADAELEVAPEVKGTVALAVLGQVKSEVKASLSAKGQYKGSFCRFQTIVLGKVGSGEELTQIYTSYDTRIRHTMMKVGGEIDVTAAAFAALAGGRRTKGWAADGTGTSYEPTLVRRMRYESSIVTWTKGKTHASSLPRDDLSASALPGSGVVYGASFVVKNLRRLYERASKKGEKPFDEKTDPYLAMLAESLHVTPTQMMEFLSNKEVEGHIQGSTFHLREYGGLIVEAGFRIPPATLDSLSDPKNPTRPGLKYQDNLVEQRLVRSLREDTIDRLLECSGRVLESIRLRYRKLDHEVTSGSEFQLGITLFDVKIARKMTNVSRIGWDGVVDLATIFCEQKPGGPSKSRQELYEAAVPPAMLFCQ